jgi:hypothetical protein
MSMASSDTYEVIFEVRDSPMAAAIEKSVADARRLDAQWQSTMNSMRQRTAALSEGVGESIRKIPSLFDNIKKSAGDATSEIGRMAVGFAVFTVGRQLITGMRDALVDLRQYTVSMNKDLTDMQLRLAEVQSISGRAGAGGAQVLQEHLDLMKYTGMTSEQATKFTGEFTGEAEIYREKFSPADFQQIQMNAARFAMIHGGDTGTHAAIAGRLAGYAAPGTNADEIMRQQAEVYRLLNAGAGNTAQLAASYNNALATLVSPTGEGGQVGSARNLAGLAVGASRLGAPATVDTTLERFANVMTGQTRSPVWTKFLREEMKIPEGTTAEAAMGPIFARMQRESAGGKDLMQWAKDMGIANAAERRTLVGMYNQRQGIQQEMARPEVTAEQARQVLTDPYTLGRAGFRPELAMGRAVAGTKAAELEQAQQNQLAEIFRQRAVTELTRENQIGPQWAAGLGAGEKFSQMLADVSYGKDITSRQKIDERAAMIYERETNRRLPTGGRYDREGPGGMFGVFGGKPGKYGFVDESYVSSNQLSADINQSESGRRFGFDAASGRATGVALDDAEVKKAILETRDHTRKDRPMTVAKPAPGVRP